MRARTWWARLVELVLCGLVVFSSGESFAQLGPGEIPKVETGRWRGSFCGTVGTQTVCSYGYGADHIAASGDLAADMNRDGQGDTWCSGGGSKSRNRVYKIGTEFTYNHPSCNIGWYQTWLPYSETNRNCGTGAVTNSQGTSNTCYQFEGTFCPDGSSATPGNPNTCTCNTGWVKNGDICVQDNCFTRGAKSAAEYAASVGSSWLDGPEGETCMSGCVVAWANRYLRYDGQWYGSNPYPTGKTCNQAGGDQVEPEPVDPAASAPEGEKVCPKGQCPGSVNGTGVCMPCQESRQTETVETSDNGTVTKKTTCTGGVCTTTESSAGIGGGEKTTSESLPDYCSRYPLSGHCSGVTNNGSGASKVDTGLTGGGSGGSGTCTTPPCGDDTPSTFGGACAAGFTCSGDAVQCAIARDQHIRHCQLMETPNALSEVGDAAMTGQARPDGHPGASGGPGTSLAFSTVISQQDLLSGGCPVDVSVSVMGQSLVMPFGTMCGELAMIGQVLVGICMLAAVGIVFKN